jgi:hypothetical protein
MQDYTLLRTQQNRFLPLVQKVGLNPTEFDWTTEKRPIVGGGTYLVSKLVHSPSQYWILFDIERTRFSPGARGRAEDEGVYSGYPGGELNRRLESADHWLEYLKREVTAPDLWGALRQEREIAELAAAPNLDERPFDDQEHAHIRRQLNELKLFVLAATQLQIEQRQFVEDRFKYFEESAQRLGRKDWLNLFLGGLLSIIIVLSLPSNTAGELFRMANAAFRASVNVVPRLP